MLLSRLRLISQLSKARLSALVASTAGFGFVAAGSPIDVATLACVVSGTFLTASSASAFNQIIEVRSDALMKRTRMRPLPAGRLALDNAKAFGVAAGAAGISVLYAGANPLTALLGAVNLLLYTNVYTPVKKVTSFNTELGAVVGAIPPVMGWAAATGTVLAPEAAALASILFLWQMPHFLSLAWILRRDYAAGGYRMRSLHDAAGARTAMSALMYSALLFPLPIITSGVDMTSVIFSAHGTLANAFLLHRAWRFHETPSDSTARSLFRTSLWHLPLLTGLFAFHKLNDHKENAFMALDEVHIFGKRLCLHEGLATHSVAKDLCPTSSDTEETLRAR